MRVWVEVLVLSGRKVGGSGWEGVRARVDDGESRRLENGWDRCLPGLGGDVRGYRGAICKFMYLVRSGRRKS